MIKSGWKVKIEDVGMIAVCIDGGKHMSKFEICGFEFWMENEKVEVVEK